MVNEYKHTPKLAFVSVNYLYFPYHYVKIYLSMFDVSFFQTTNNVRVMMIRVLCRIQ